MEPSGSQASRDLAEPLTDEASSPPSIAVIDVETTGLNPYAYHRIVEIGVVLIDPAGNVLREFETLLNPERDVGATAIHGLAPSDLIEAPLFAEMAGVLLQTVEGSVAIAGHNINFDHRFLQTEFERLDCPLPELPVLCTMRLAGGGSLERTCADFGVSFDGRAHSALDDARATARLLAALLADEPSRSAELVRLPAIRWPQVPRTTRCPLCRDAARKRAEQPPDYLRRLLNRVITGDSAEDDDSAISDYMALLTRALEDRHISDNEGRSLCELAERLDLSPAQIRRANKSYLDQLAYAALADGVVSEAERRDLAVVASMLGLSESDIDRAIFDAASQRSKAAASGQVPIAVACEEPLTGMRVCFTGESQCLWQGEPLTRAVATSLATERGLTIAESVTKKLDILVVTDPHTQSGKAKRARQYGTRILQERAFWQTLGVEVG